ncbi:GAF domain-containing sensor histidine kinase [Paenibacillus thermotolerans]|uniref:GAF domain-containing sensor histidine kinase n=1 Tax=Paenibacillus thermotolerans TaxID=3027807 RepID=UPI00236819C0|nr:MULTISPECIES: GAF domain-containing sensor histidine kinase [unclassified Paenibacillus]
MNDHSIRINDLEMLREIAETINQAYELEPMLNSVLNKLLEVTGLTSGWIFWADKTPEQYTFAADLNLPPALQRNGKQPMREGSCWCLERFWDGRLHHAVNILNCARLENAVRYKWGDTKGISHHATIPIRSGDDLIGILNVAAPGKVKFTEQELAVLQSVAYQIGTAAHRIRLYRKERKRAYLFEKLGGVARQLGSKLDGRNIAAETAAAAGLELGWASVAVYIKEGRRLVRKALFSGGKLEEQTVSHSSKQAGALWAALTSGRPSPLPAGRDPHPDWSSGFAAALGSKGKPIGVIAVGSATPDPLDDVDAEVLAALAAHFASAYENVRLHEQSKEIAKWEERNRIARDLHDSVSQMLFSLSLHSKGLEAALKDAPPPVVKGAQEISRLSRDALAEMRTMIRQLRPAGLEEGLLTALHRYGESIGVRVTYKTNEVRQIPDRVEETLLRVGQEAINNVSKHSGTDNAAVTLHISDRDIRMTIADKGRGVPGGSKKAEGYGMSTMKERAEALGGTVTVKSRTNKGTMVIVLIPMSASRTEEL